MKKYLKVLALSAIMLSMIACGTKTSNSGEEVPSAPTSATDPDSVMPPLPSDEVPSAPTSVTESVSTLPPLPSIVDETEWSSEAVSAMRQVLGEILPFIQLGNDYSASVEEDDTGEYVYICDESSVDIVSGYGAILQAAGFTYAGEDEDTDFGYTAYFYSKGNIIVQIDYFPGYGEYPAGNEIYAWIIDNDDDDDDDNGNDQEFVPQTDLTEWPEDLAQAMNDYCGYEIPFVAIGNDFTYVEYNGYFIIYDSATVDYLKGYDKVLEDSGFTLNELNTDYGYDVYVYVMQISDDYNLVVQYAFYPADENYPSSNEIDIYLSPIPKFSQGWPLDAIEEVFSDLAENIPSFESDDGQYAYTINDSGLVIQGLVSEDITDEYVSAATEKGLLVGVTIDWSILDYVDYIYDWEENFMITYAYEDGIFQVSITPVEASYDSLEETFPEDLIVSFLGEEATSVPSFDCLPGSTYKVSQVEEDPEYGTSAYLSITVVDNGTAGSDAIEDTYKALLESLNWTIDDSNYEQSGYVAVSPNEDVVLTFYTYDGLFNLFVEANTSSDPDIGDGVVFDLTSVDQITTNTADLVVYEEGEFVFSIEKGSATAAANNYLGGESTNAHTRVYKGGILKFECESGLSVIVIECTDANYASAFAGMATTSCSISVDGTKVTITPTEGATSCSVNTANSSQKHVRIYSVTML